jgi:hypothetical protein
MERYARMRARAIVDKEKSVLSVPVMPGVYTTGAADKLIAPTWAGIIETAVLPRVTNIADVRLTTWF